jgi:hypothetical protein
MTTQAGKSDSDSLVRVRVVVLEGGTFEKTIERDDVPGEFESHAEGIRRHGLHLPLTIELEAVA